MKYYKKSSGAGQSSGRSPLILLSQAGSTGHAAFENTESLTSKDTHLPCVVPTEGLGRGEEGAELFTQGHSSLSHPTSHRLQKAALILPFLIEFPMPGKGNHHTPFQGGPGGGSEELQGSQPHLRAGTGRDQTLPKALSSRGTERERELGTARRDPPWADGARATRLPAVMR